ncbi:hypothetical protein SP90_12315 [Halodesulfovibrio spirochaetisodalis]|uniref:DUF1656 domain-containing protein n=1 Tax=Halodesulfovibrio spirochaetisodalis TaxID=1560234 RepID=A0A1B7XAT0_9BACT|nr:hypothetical protein SP90_12315 [Halodesulfovibrio spirochaetisodalis]
MPKEIAFIGIYFPPSLVGLALAFLLALITAFLLNYFRLARFFWHPPLIFVALMVIYWVLISRFVIFA